MHPHSAKRDTPACVVPDAYVWTCSPGRTPPRAHATLNELRVNQASGTFVSAYLFYFLVPTLLILFLSNKAKIAIEKQSEDTLPNYQHRQSKINSFLEKLMEKKKRQNGFTISRRSPCTIIKSLKQKGAKPCKKT